MNSTNKKWRVIFDIFGEDGCEYFDTREQAEAFANAYQKGWTSGETQEYCENRRTGEMEWQHRDLFCL